MLPRCCVCSWSVFRNLPTVSRRLSLAGHPDKRSTDLKSRLLELSCTNATGDFVGSKSAIAVDASVRDGEPSFEDLAASVTPLWRLPYEEQLELKTKKNHSILQKLTSKLRPDSPPGDVICQLVNTIPSPVTEHYRNKDEFHVRYNRAGEVVVGLCVGKSSEGTLECVSPEGLINTRPTHTRLARLLQDYVGASRWKVCEHFQRGGHWRNFIVRSNGRNEVMLIAVVHPQHLNQQDIHTEMLNWRDHLLSSNDATHLKSIYYQTCTHTRCTAEESPFVLIHGDPYIYERVGDFNFRISPESFFQVNTEGARVLYEVVGKQLKPNKMSTVLDVCCGTGTHGIMVARHCRGVVGIELSQSAIRDAKFNAAMNGAHNTEFISGRVERIFGSVLEQLATAPEICAIVNPSRGGVDGRVIKLLRDDERVRHLVYVSCQADGPAMKNFVDLCRRPSKTNRTKPFRLEKATPVDMFPHTDHCELVLSFKR